MRCDVASTSEALTRSTSACALLTFWPATAICSARPDILASDSFNFERARSKIFLREAKVSSARTKSNLIRSQALITSCNSISVRSIIADTSIAEFPPVEPPRTRIRLRTSPSRVIAITDGSAFKADSASAKESTAIKPESKEAIACETSLEETRDASEVKPAGIERFEPVKPPSPSTTRSSDCPADSRFSIVSAETADETSETTTASASGPRAAATAASQPGVTVIKDERRPRVLVADESTTPEPSRSVKDS